MWWSSAHSQQHKPCRETAAPGTPQLGKAPQWSTCIDSDSHHGKSNLEHRPRGRGQRLKLSSAQKENHVSGMYLGNALINQNLWRMTTMLISSLIDCGSKWSFLLLLLQHFSYGAGFIGFHSTINTIKGPRVKLQLVQPDKLVFVWILFIFIQINWMDFQAASAGGWKQHWDSQKTLIYFQI